MTCRRLHDQPAVMLTFNDAPDFEARDADGDNTYMVTVMASAGGEMDTQDVMVRVTNVDEMGLTVTLWAVHGRLTMAPHGLRGDTITAVWMDAGWLLGRMGGDDAGAFSISSTGRVLSFGSDSRLRERRPTWAWTTSTWLTTMASDGTNMDSRDVMVTVTDVDDDGVVTPEPGDTLLDRYDANDNNGQIDRIPRCWTPLETSCSTRLSRGKTWWPSSGSSYSGGSR